MNRVSKIVLLLCLSISISAQETLSLERFIALVEKQNIDLQMAGNNTSISKLQYRQQQLSFMPTLDAGFNHNITFGTAFDNVTFRRVQKTTQNSFPSLNLNVNLFNGLAWHFQRKYAAANFQSVKLQQQQKQQEYILLATQVYFNTLASEATVALYQSRVKQMENLHTLVKRQYEGGTKSQQDLFTVQAQYEAEQLNLLNAQQQWRNNKYEICKLARLPLTDSIHLEKPNLNSSAISLPDSGMIKRRPAVLAAMMASTAAKQMPLTALSGLLPRLNLYAGIASNYSSNGIFDPDLGIIYPSFGKQMGLNFYQFVGISLQIPIVAEMQHYFNPRIQHFNHLNARLDYEKTLQQTTAQYLQLSSNIAMADKKITVANSKLSAAQEAFKVADANYKAGAINFYDYLLALNNQSQAELDLLQVNFEKAVLATESQMWK